MAFFNKGGKASYEPLEAPRVATVHLPNVTMLSKKVDLAMCQQLARVAAENLSSNGGPDGGARLSETLRQFECDLIDLVGAEKEAGVRLGARMGYIIGMMENGGGAERPGQSESHYRFALDLLTHDLPSEYASLASEFAKEGGYFLARSRDQALESLLMTAKAGVETIRS